MKKICLNPKCNKEFSTEDKRQKFCCARCNYDFRPVNKAVVKCDFCGKELKIYPSRLKIAHHFCDKNCQNKWQENAFLGNSNPSWSGGRIAKVCTVCHRTYKARIKASKFCGDKCRLYDLNSTHYDETHPSWKGGVTPERRRMESTVEYQQWKKNVFARDKYHCVMCGSTHKIEAHHIKTFADFKELRMSLDNGITLCHEHHLKTYGKEEVYEPYFINVNTFLKSFYEIVEPRIMLV